MSAYAVPPPDPNPRPRRINLGDGLEFWMSTEEFVAQGYLESGLYRDGELVYTTIFIYPSNRLFFSDDAMSFIVIADDGTLFESRRLVWFYEQGVLLRYYTAQDLFRNVERTQQARESLYWPMDFISSIFSTGEDGYDRANNRLRLTTSNEGGEIVFCLSTGYILSISEPPGQIITIMAAIVGPLLALVGITAVFRKKFSRSNKN